MLLACCVWLLLSRDNYYYFITIILFIKFVLLNVLVTDSAAMIDRMASEADAETKL